MRFPQSGPGRGARRAFSAGLLGASVLADSGPAVTSVGSKTAEDDRERLYTIIRMMGRTYGGIAIRWTDAVLSAIIDQRTTPLLGVSRKIFTRHRLNDDGSFDAVHFEIV